MALRKVLRQSELLGETSCEISAAQLHRILGGYPGPNHRFPSACQALRRVMTGHDTELPGSLKKNGATYAFRFRLPRSS